MLTIKQNIQLINELLNTSYGNLQKLAYEEEVKQHKNKNRVKKG